MAIIPFFRNYFSFIFQLTPSFLQLLLYALLFLLTLFYIGGTYSLHRDIPGPFLAKFTDYWRLRTVWRRDSHDVYLALHKKYGDLVRIGPNCISVCKPDIIPTIYGIGKGYVKSGFYEVWQNMVNGKRVASLVFTTDEALHARMKKPIAAAYSLSTLKEFEPLIDSTTAVFLSRLDKLFAETGKACDLSTWLGWYAFDVIGELTLSKRLGFLERGEDVEGIGASVAANFDRCSVLGQMSWLDLVTWKNPIYQRFFAKPVSSPIIEFGQRRLAERTKGGDDDHEPIAIEIKDPSLREKVLHGTLPSKPDFLSRFLALHEEHPDTITDRQLLAYLFMNINAGSDTIASTVRATFYHLLRHPSTLSTLLSELETAHVAGSLTLPLPTWSECQALPYLNAVIKESLRLNPALALRLERIVPRPGLNINYEYLPPGTIVGVNPWVLHRDPRIFGADAETWNPGRWIPDPEADAEKEKERVRYMDVHILSFGSGKRTCLGRNIAMLELTKLVPAVVLRYRMRFADGDGERWRVRNSWAVRQEGLDVLLEKW